MIRKRVAKAVIALFVLIALALLGYDFLLQRFWIGSVKLTVYADLQGREPCRLLASVLLNEEYADDDEHYLDEPLRPGHLTVIPDFRGAPFQVSVRTTGNDSGLGRERWYAQYRCLAIWIERKGTPRKRVLVPIPDVRHEWEVTVLLP